MPAGFSRTFRDDTVTMSIDPLLVLSLPENVVAYFSAALADVDAVPAAGAAAQIVQLALERATVEGSDQFGTSMSAVLLTVYVMFENSWGPAAASGLSEDEVAALEKHRFAAGNEEEEEACSVCPEEYREGVTVIRKLL